MELTKEEKKMVTKKVDKWAEDLVRIEGRFPTWSEICERQQFYIDAILINRGLEKYQQARLTH